MTNTIPTGAHALPLLVLAAVAGCGRSSSGVSEGPPVSSPARSIEAVGPRVLGGRTPDAGPPTTDAAPPDVAANRDLLALATPAKKIDRASAKKIVRTVLKAPDAMVLIRIPWGTGDLPPRDPKGIGGYAIEASRDARYPAAVGRALDSFIGYTGDESWRLPSCFAPHHAIVATAGTNRIEVLICFECARFEIRVDGYQGALEWSMRDWEEEHAEYDYREIFEALALQSGVPPAKDARSKQR